MIPLEKLLLSVIGVQLMLLYHCQTLCTQTTMSVGKSDYKREINIRKSFEALGDDKSQVLVGFHAFTGCDQTRKFDNHAKQSYWNTFNTSPKKVINAFMLLGNSIKHPTEERIDGIIMFFLNLYFKNCLTGIDNLSKLRWHMFSKKQLKSDKLPPIFSALKLYDLYMKVCY